MGTVVFSVDAELGWGFHHLDPIPADRVRSARLAWTRLLDLFDRYRIPATWAVVGHLLLEECDAEHAEHPAGARLCARDCDGASAGDLWFGNGLVDAVRGADAGHEIAGHGFTHVHFRHERVTRAFAASELRALRDAAADRGLESTSFVFPVNEVGYRDLLAEYGFRCYRGARPAAGPGSRRARKAVAAALNRGTPPIVTPTVDEFGLVNVPASAYLFDFDGRARSLVETVRGDPVVERVGRGLDRLVETDGLLHLWLHPHNLRTPRDYDRLRTILALVDRRRDELRVETMREVAERVRAADGGARTAAHRPDGGGQ